MFSTAHKDEMIASAMDDRFVINTVTEGKTHQARKKAAGDAQRRAKKRQRLCSKKQHAAKPYVRDKPPGRLFAFYTLTCPETLLAPLGHALDKYRGLVNAYIAKTYEEVELDDNDDTAARVDGKPRLDEVAKRCHLGSQFDDAPIEDRATRGRLARRYPHVVGEYFDYRVTTFLQVVLADAFDLDDFFVRYEVRAPPLASDCRFLTRRASRMRRTVWRGPGLAPYPRAPVRHAVQV